METKATLLQERPEKKDNVLSLSVSKIKTFKDCPAKYRYGYIEKLPRKERDYLVFGKFVHEVLEKFHKTYLDPQAPLFSEMPHVVLSDCFNQSYHNWKNQLTKEQKDKSMEICTQYLKKISQDKKNNVYPEILSVEQEFYIDIDGKILLNGFIDRVQKDVDGILHVADYKTTNNKSFLKKDFMQLLTYAYVKCLEDPSLKKVRTSYILLKHNFESIVKDFELDEIMTVEQDLLDYAEQINSEKLFRPKPTKLCDFCDYKDEPCKAYAPAQSKSFGPVEQVAKFGITDW